MTVASWLLVVDPEAVDSARHALAGADGVECRGLAGGRLVVVTESAEGRGLEPVHDALLAVPGVRSAALVAAFEEGEEDRK